MSLQSLQVLKGSECSHFWWMMLFTLERFTGPPIGNLINISYHMSLIAYPRLRDAYVGMVFNLAQTIRFVSEPGIRNFRPTIVSSNLIRYASGIIFEKSNSRIYVLKILFQSFN